jgi:aminopeptidase N
MGHGGEKNPYAYLGLLPLPAFDSSIVSRLSRLSHPLLLAALVAVAAVAVTADASAQPAPSDPSASGGRLIPEQAAFDVHYYDLQLEVRPEERAIEGQAATHATIVLPTDALVLDLDTTFAVAQVVDVETGETLPFERLGGRLLIDLGWTKQPGDSVAVRVDYAGQPRVAQRPPWVGGFTWVERPDGTHWVGVSVQGEGADLWWPVKDHPSDEPDSLRLRATVPAGHTAVSAGRLRDATAHADGTTTFDWFTSTPINNYGLSLYVAPYEAVTADYTSTAGDDLPVTFYALPEDRAKAEALLPQIVDHVRFMEETFGPYPFRADKYAVVQAPYLGMEHQTAIAYGDAFTDNAFGFDWLHLHELAHEWWGNLVTVPDWRHFWLHEGFAMYVEALYAERLSGPDAYRRYLRSKRGRIVNQRPVVPAAATDTQEAHFGTGRTDSDVYFKGMWFLHTLRYAVDDDAAFLRALRRMAYPDPALEAVTDGRQARFATTDDFQRTVEHETGRDVGALFRLYLAQPALPRLVTERRDGRLDLRWETPAGYPLELPVEVAVDGEVRRVRMRGGRGALAVPPDAKVVVDPDDWILKAE